MKLICSKYANKLRKMTLLLIISLISSNAFSQDLLRIVSYADSLTMKKMYSEGLNEYQRAYYFSNNLYKSQIAKKIADYYLHRNDIIQAKSYIDSAIIYARSDSSRMEYSLDNIYCTILQQEFLLAINKLNMIDSNTIQTIYIRKNVYQGYCNLETGDFDSAYFFFNNCIEKNDLQKYQELRKLFEKSHTLRKPRPVIALILSTAIPGAGQFYAHEYLAGLNSFLLIGTINYLALYTKIIDPLLLISFLPRYYIGGIIHARMYAELNRKAKVLKFYNQVFSTLNLTENSGKNLSPYYSFQKQTKEIINKKNELPQVIMLSYKLYKKTISSQDVDACVFTPSCSDFTKQAIEKYGIFKGTLVGFDRLMRCHAFVDKRSYLFDEAVNKHIDEP